LSILTRLLLNLFYDLIDQVKTMFTTEKKYFLLGAGKNDL